MTPFNIFPEKRNYYIYELESFRTSKTDRHSLRQKVRQRISVMKTNTAVFVVVGMSIEKLFDM